jgi:hypothetical protein
MNWITLLQSVCDLRYALIISLPVPLLRPYGPDWTCPRLSSEPRANTYGFARFHNHQFKLSTYNSMCYFQCIVILPAENKVN